MPIRRAEQSDADGIWAILKPVIRGGETYALPRDMARADALAYWMAPEKRTFVAEEGGEILGTYYLRANQAGGGDHVCNCGYVTGEEARGRGVGRAMCEHSLAEAARAGFRAMQFNSVVSTNEGAVRLWETLGFEIVGTLPRAFRHPVEGEVDVYVMYRALAPGPDEKAPGG